MCFQFVFLVTWAARVVGPIWCCVLRICVFFAPLTIVCPIALNINVSGCIAWDCLVKVAFVSETVFRHPCWFYTYFRKYVLTADSYESLRSSLRGFGFLDLGSPAPFPSVLSSILTYVLPLIRRPPLPISVLR